jgi:hypothetical protein
VGSHLPTNNWLVQANWLGCSWESTSFPPAPSPQWTLLGPYKYMPSMPLRGNALRVLFHGRSWRARAGMELEGMWEAPACASFSMGPHLPSAELALFNLDLSFSGDKNCFTSMVPSDSSLYCEVNVASSPCLPLPPLFFGQTEGACWRGS